MVVEAPLWPAGAPEVLGKEGRFWDIPLPRPLLRRLGRHIAGRPWIATQTEPSCRFARGYDGGYEPLTRPQNLEPVWNLLDLTPEGRPLDWDEQFSYA
jgi:hypothetical protein